jgi:transcriptional regulator with XRE-family HTH domain
MHIHNIAWTFKVRQYVFKNILFEVFYIMSKLNNTNKLTGERIKQLRTKLGMYQTDLADKLGVVRENISKYERGAVTPPSNVLNAIAEVLNTSTDYLLGNTENSDPVDAEAEFHRDIDLSDEDLLNKYNFTFEGQKLDEETIKSLLNLIRAGKRRQ